MHSPTRYKLRARRKWHFAAERNHSTTVQENSLPRCPVPKTLIPWRDLRMSWQTRPATSRHLSRTTSTVRRRLQQAALLTQTLQANKEDAMKWESDSSKAESNGASNAGDRYRHVFACLSHDLGLKLHRTRALVNDSPSPGLTQPIFLCTQSSS